MSNNLFITLIIIVLICISSLTEFKAQDKTQTGSRTIYLIRHGQYNIDDDRDPDVGKELVPLGIAQTRLLSARLKSMGIKFTSLTSSTMTRARQTAMIITEEFPDLDLHQSKIIRECTPPTWRKDIMVDESESDLNECVENLEKAFKEYFIPSPDKNDRNDIIVCHGNVIRYFVTKILKVDTMAWLQMSIANCSLTIVRIKPDGTMKLDSFSDSGHISNNMQTYTGGNNDIKELKIKSLK
jgi:serine/threonine-protein phosphatase PGAM5